MVPVHNYYGLPVRLQQELLQKKLHGENTRTPFNSRQVEDFWNDLSYYLTMGYHPRGVMSNLCGMFWEPDIPCNLVSAWLYPPFELLPHAPGIDGDKHCYYVALVRKCALRRPNVAALFLGASLPDLLDPTVFHFVKSGLSVLDLDAAAWMDSERSFIQSPGSSETSNSSAYAMSRADIWRLLYITDSTGQEYRSPLTPWKPFGEMNLWDVPLASREHQGCCSEHYLRYQCWSWELADGSTLVDEGRQKDTSPWGTLSSSSSTIFCPKSPLGLNDCRTETFPQLDYYASEVATRQAFKWVVVNG